MQVAEIRIVKDIFCKQLIKQFGKPVISTSANISGTLPPGNFDEINEQIKRGVDYIVRYRQEETLNQMASTIVKFNKDGTVQIIRP